MGLLGIDEQGFDLHIWDIYDVEVVPAMSFNNYFMVGDKQVQRWVCTAQAEFKSSVPVVDSKGRLRLNPELVKIISHKLTGYLNVSPNVQLSISSYKERYYRDNSEVVLYVVYLGTPNNKLFTIYLKKTLKND